MDSNQTIHPIVTEILSESITSASQLLMKYKLGCFEIDEKFCSDFLYTLTSYKDNGFKIMKDCVRRGWFSEFFKQKEVLKFLVENMDSLKFLTRFRKDVVAERCKAILYELSYKRPGLIIGYYLKTNPDKKNPQKINASFEEFVVKLSQRLAKSNSEYRQKIHKRVIMKYEENWIRENSMK